MVAAFFAVSGCAAGACVRLLPRVRRRNLRPILTDAWASLRKMLLEGKK
ncbi:hypothetical protein HMPREF0372_00917 [Flavonifractor plautii ATCC 29863]|uniref:Uncharacterized protein n=1 Tax=Flavonifractor plautii ATCC 29863 TaxID=411475 RepID=G9YN45_FLAPL|nr:hypothetical protein HMPREF0372_00917 [Flavonifractor plautii ATCC 29863]